MNGIDKVIFELFTSRWCGEEVTASLGAMQSQLYKSLTDQVNGWWSGHTAYHIMIDGGFLVDAKSNTSKKLTALGREFVSQYDNRGNV